MVEGKNKRRQLCGQPTGRSELRDAPIRFTGFRMVPMFGRNTIRRSSSSISNLSRLAARAFEDVLRVHGSSIQFTNVDSHLAQCAIPIFDGLLPDSPSPVITSSSVSSSNSQPGTPSESFGCTQRPHYFILKIARRALGNFEGLLHLFQGMRSSPRNCSPC